MTAFQVVQYLGLRFGQQRLQHRGFLFAGCLAAWGRRLLAGFCHVVQDVCCAGLSSSEARGLHSTRDLPMDTDRDNYSVMAWDSMRGV